ncbi:MAG: carboxypeptidase regulatory-like domain-containing protein [Blastocatellia bacterium]
MKSNLLRLITSAIFLMACALSVFAQTTTAPISGSVTDQNGAVISGAVVLAKNEATGAESKATTTSNGTYTVPALGVGHYTVTVEAQGFKRAVVQAVTIDAGVPATVNITLEVGAPTESVVVQGGAEILQTQSATVSTTLSTEQIGKLPLQSRNTIYFLTLLPGVSSSATTSIRNSTINGLPSSAYNVTIDGLNTQDNLLKSTDGFFSYINPTVDAIQEVTLSTATPGAESSGQGAIQIKFVTRQGNNDLHGSLYYYHRNTAFNTNYWFTNRDVVPVDNTTGLRCDNIAEAYNPDKCRAPKAVALFHQFGGRVGGPIMVPKLFNGKDKAFYFVNFEEFRQPSSIARTRTIFNPTTQAGTFQYVVGGTTRTVNLLDLARANGQTATIDPTVGKLLAEIRSSTASTGGITQLSDPNLQNFSFTNTGNQRRYFPTVRLDFNLTSKHHLENTYNYQSYVSTPDFLNNRDPIFPNFPNQGGQYSNRFTEGMTLRSTLSPTLVNEARVGLTGGTVLFYPDFNAGQFVNQGGFSLGINAAGISSATAGTGPERRNAPVWDYADTVNWSRGAHNFSFGGQFTQATTWITDGVVVPSITFGLATGDPALAMFNNTNFPNASTANITAAQNIYAVLTGRVTAITANAILNEKTNKYGYQADQVRRGQQREWGFFGQDSWRARQNLTITGGLRYELQLPFSVLNDVYTTTTTSGLYGISGPGNVFKPGTLTGSPTQLVPFKKGDRAYQTDKRDFAPSIGFAWSPAVKNSFLKRVIGDGGQTVIRGGYSIAYERNGSNVFLNFDVNPGVTISATRSAGIGNLVTGTGTDTLPVLLRDTNRLGPPAFPTAPTYPLVGGTSVVAITSQAFVFDPHIKTPYAQSFSFGVQREITKDMAVEVRYIHTYNLQQWFNYNLNETNIVENGFLKEFKLAQANLQENIKAGRGNTFKYAGPGTNTSPLPIYLAYFSGQPASQAGDTTKYTSGNFGAANFVNPLALQNPNPYTPASNSSTAGLFGNATFRQNALNAGLPSNFFLANPDFQGGVFIEGNGGYSRYDALQVDLRRRMSKGLLLGANYTWGRGFAGNRASLRRGWYNSLSTLNGGTIKHAFKANWVYELPIGKGKMLLGSPGSFASRLADKAIGGWEFDGTARIQTGANINLGNVRLVGMTQKDVQKAFKIRKDDTLRRVFIYPQDIIDNTILAFSTSATSASGYSGNAPTGRYFAPANSPSCTQVVSGDCAGQTLFVQGPKFARFDLSAIKRVRITERVNFEFRAEFLNAFNTINFLGNGNTGPSSSQTFGQQLDGSAYRDANGTQDPGGRLIQLVGRINF